MLIDPKKFYNEVMPQKYGSDYERSRWHADPVAEAQHWMMDGVMRRFVLPHVGSPLRVLEIGPGPGTWTKYLLKTAPDASFTLVDISETMLAQAKESLNGNIVFIESDWVSFTSADTYDFFFSSRAFEYVNDKRAALAVVARSLGVGKRGVLITKTPKPFFDLIRGRRSSLHQGQVSPATLVRLCREAGFRVRSVHLATATVPLLRIPWLNKVVFSILSHAPFVFPLSLFSESYVVVFEKL
ncbi:MAG: class I SAM-dependent methyltransferase [Patescibacteria group bacterium]